MNQSGTPRLSIGFAPVGQSRERRAECAEEAHAERERCRSPHSRITVSRAVERKGRRPCTDRHVGEHRVQRVAKPYSMQRILGFVPNRSRGFVGLPNPFAQRLGNAIESRLIRHTRQRIGRSHTSSLHLPTWTYPCSVPSPLVAQQLIRSESRGFRFQAEAPAHCAHDLNPWYILTCARRDVSVSASGLTASGDLTFA